jgi:hypothetical protein
MMRRLRLCVALVFPVVTLALAATPTVRKDAHGVYGIIDSVVFEPRAGTPDRVQLWGFFAMADNVGIEDGKISYVQVGGFKPPQRGYLYYTVNRRDTVVSRAEWAMMKELAGTGAAVSFGGAFPPDDGTVKTDLDTAFAWRIIRYNGRLRTAAERPATPDTFPLRMPGIASSMRADANIAGRLGLYRAR